ncbi:uncharacterized protein LOC143201927 [Rhynchophorus ferrugineus]|uniref:uncharacterized protein LOC143201927 n=1 Tax=Rhynchophorus ferrugineus TaxID=354439 RepID=UPI003FCE03FB
MLLSSILVIFFTQGSIFSILSGSIYGKPITSLYEFIEVNIPLRVVKGVDILLASNSKSAEYNVMSQQYSILPNTSSLIEAGDAVLKQRNFATISDMAFILMRPNIQKAFTYFEVWNLRLCVVMRKYQYFYQQFYRWFITIVECGFYEKFERLYQSGFALKNSVEPEKRTFVLTMHHLFPSFAIIGCGMVLSMLVFIMEVVYKVVYDKLKHY